jgi:hypothetical protein
MAIRFQPIDGSLDSKPIIQNWLRPGLFRLPEPGRLSEVTREPTMATP